MSTPISCRELCESATQQRQDRNAVVVGRTMNHARSELFDRLSPEVVLRVYECIQIGRHNLSPNHPRFKKCMDLMDETISALDGQTSNGDKA